MLATVARNRRQLRDLQQPAIDRLVASYADAIDQIQDDLDALNDAVAARRAAGRDVPRWWLLRQDNLRNIRDQIEAEVGRIHASFADEVASQQRTAALLGEQHAQGLIDEALGPRPPHVTVSFNQLPVGAIEEIIAQTGPGTALTELLDRLGPIAGERVRESLIMGIITGRHPNAIARLIEEAMGMPLARAITIARTEQLRAYRESSRRTYHENRHLVTAWRWVSARDERTCMSCLMMDGTLHETSEVFGTHPRCFPAGTLVEGPAAVAGSGRMYSGPVVEIVTAFGHRLTCTPNHPILTPEGWVAAGLLDEGGHVISRRFGEGPLPAVDPDEYQVPARIEDVVSAFAGTPGVSAVRVPTAAEAFHGDGIGSEVHVVYANRLGERAVDTAFAEPALQQALVRGDVELLAFDGQRSGAPLLPGVRTSSGGFVCGHCVTAMLLGRPVRHHHSIGFGARSGIDAGVFESQPDSGTRDAVRLRQRVLRFTREVTLDDLLIGQRRSVVAANLDTGFSQYAYDDLVGDAEFSAEFVDRFAGFVAADEVVEIRRYPFANHVYNLQTLPGWYIANGIVTHNCRCTMTPVTKSWSELGFEDIPDRRPDLSTGRDWFLGLVEDVQRDMLGPAKFDAWQAGEFALDDLVGFRHDRKWGPVRWERSLKDILGSKAAKEFYPQAAG